MRMLGRQGRLQRASERAEIAFAHSPLDGEALDHAARAYLDALRLALKVAPSTALSLFRRFDERIPTERYGQGWPPADQRRLRMLAASDDPDVLTVVYALASRLGGAALQRETADRLTARLSQTEDANRLVSHLVDCLQLGFLSPETLTRALHGFLAHTGLAREAELWRNFFASLPQTLLPPLFEVQSLLERGAEAVELADTPARQREALAICVRSPRLADAHAGLDLARRLDSADADVVRRLEARMGDLLVGAGRHDEALPHYREAGRADRLSECHERLGQHFEALVTCSAEQSDRLARLAERCHREVDEFVALEEFIEAARLCQGLVVQLARASEETDAVAAGRAEAARLREGVLAAGRDHFSRLVEQEAPSAQHGVYERWSRFEEEAGELAGAARRAQDAGNRYRAYRLFSRAERFGDASRVFADDDSPEGSARRAEACEAGGDLAGAAGLYERAGELEQAVELFQQAGQFGAAARCLIQLKADAAIEDPRLAIWLRRVGDLDGLVRLCLDAIERKGRSTNAVNELRQLLEASILPPAQASGVQSALERVSVAERSVFERRVRAWVAQSRREVDERYARIWGFDLGTTTCSAAIYDAQTRQPVICPWKGRPQFASTLTLDVHSNEFVGLTGEESFASQVVGHIVASKRRMGTGTRYRVRERTYRPEDVAARLVRHARGLVEDFLAAQVRERVGELARAELGEVADDWLSWTEHHHDLRLSRPQVLLTVPAFFRNNQKGASRDAGHIAGVDVVRLIHEPTAACLTAGHQQRVSGRVIVVDLGAGTLDISLLDVSDGIYQVQEVVGNNHYGSKDFDAAISRALEARLQGQGISVPDTGVARLRLEVAAERLKVELSSLEHAECSLPGFAGGRDVRLELSRVELGEILAEPLCTLRDTCAALASPLSRHGPLDHLVLVGGPMLSPLVRGVVEDVFGMRGIDLADPRTAVACGAALQAAVLAGKSEKTLLLDVTPFSLGIRIVDDHDQERFSMLIDPNTTIPVKRTQPYTTRKDNQTKVDIEVFQGDIDPQSKIGQFQLVGIPRAPKGQPQIDVTFEIDASCVLEVTARDRATGAAKTIRITDTTLLSPIERDALTERFRRQRAHAEQRQRLLQVREELQRQVTEVTETAVGALLREWRRRLDAYRPTAHVLDEGIQQALVEMFHARNELEIDLELANAPLRDLVRQAKEYLARTDEQAIDEAVPLDAQHLIAELRAHLERLRPLLSRLTGWNALLIELGDAETDPLRRFLVCHEVGDYDRALDALAELTTAPDHPPYILRQLDCLARVGDADGYRRVWATQAEQLDLASLEPAQPETFLALLRPALVTVWAVRGDGSRVQGCGFMVSDSLVVTNARLFVDAETVEVGVGAVTRKAQRISRAPSGDVALLRLTEAETVVTFRLGYAELVRVGDRVWTATSTADAEARCAGDLVHGVVDAFESFPEQNLRLFRVGLRVPRRCSGGPLLNDLGEVVGILTVAQPEATSDPEAPCFAQTIDSLEPLLTQAGLSRWGG